MSAHAVVGIRPDAPRVVHVAAIAASSLACTVLYLFDPSDGGYPLCPFRAVTGLFCPGCGTLRASNRLLHGRIGDAFGFNALAVLLLPVLIYAFASSLLVAAGRPSLPRPRIPAAWIWAFGFVAVAFAVVRNIPIEPLTALAP